MKNISYQICSDTSLCGILRKGIKDIRQAWVYLEEVKVKWPDAMIEEVEEVPYGGRIYHAIEIVVNRTPYAQHMEKIRLIQKNQTSG